MVCYASAYAGEDRVQLRRRAGAGRRGQRDRVGAALAGSQSQAVAVARNRLAQARVDADQAGLAIVYVLHIEGSGLRVTDLAEQLRIDAAAITRRRSSWSARAWSAASDTADAGPTRLHLTPEAAGRSAGPGRPAQVADQSAGGWPEPEQAEFARLLRQFSSDIQRQTGELDD